MDARIGSIHQQAKKLRKILISTVLWLLCDFLSLKNDVNVTSKRNKHKKVKNIFLGILKVTNEGSIRRYGCEDQDLYPDPYQNVTDPKHGFCLQSSVQCYEFMRFWYESGSSDSNTDLQIRILLFSSVAFKMPTKMIFLLITSWRYTYISRQR